METAETANAALELLIAYVIMGVITGILGGKLYEYKNRPSMTGFWLGALLGFFGLIYAAGIPPKKKKKKVEEDEDE